MITLSLLSLLPCSAKEVLKLGYFELPPFSYTESNQVKGIAIDYIKSVFKNQNQYRIVFEKYPFQRLLVEMEKSRLDGAVLLAKNKAREKIFSYPQNAYISDRPAIVFRMGNSPSEIKEVKDIQKYDIGLPAKAYISPFIAKNKDQLKLKYIPSGVDHLEPMMLSLAKKRSIQALYLPTQSTLVAIAKKLGILEKLSFRKTPEEAENFYTVFKKDIHPNVLSIYNKENMNFINDQKLREMISK